MLIWPHVPLWARVIKVNWARGYGYFSLEKYMQSAVALNEEKLRENALASYVNSKRVTFEQVQPSVKSEKKPHDALPQA
jgi:hypothetical protein